MLQTILKEATKSYHRQLEQLMYVDEIINGTLTLQQYKQLLTTNYLVQAACENYLFNSLSFAVAVKLNIKKCSKIPALIAGINELKLVLPQQINGAQQLTILKNDVAVLGALYVLEGATLGRHVIEKKLLNNAAFTHLNLNLHYYRVYCSSLILYWKAFCEVLNQQPPETHAISAAAVKKMFEYIMYVQQQTCNTAI